MNQAFLVIICATIVIIILLIIAIAITIPPDSEKISNDIPLIFIHIPKTGGTTIHEIAKANRIKWRYCEKVNREECDCNKWHIPPSEKIKELKKSTFCVVRNPYTRIISEYRYKSHHLSVDRLNKYIADRMKILENRRCIDDCHWIPQHKYTIYCDHILRFENLHNDFDELMAKYNLKYRLNQHRNKSTGKTFEISDISKDNLKLINSHYKKDFEMFGYEMVTGNYRDVSESIR